MEEDSEILTTLLKHMPSCMSADDIEQLLQEISVHLSAVVPVRTVQVTVAAGDLPPEARSGGEDQARAYQREQVQGSRD